MHGLIGGSGSTGSSLLRQLLNRHSKIFCGPESSLFCKAELFDNWEKHKNKIQSKGLGGLKSNSFHVYRGIDLTLAEYGFSENMILGLIEQSASFASFCKTLFGVALDRQQKSICLEKTPGNAYNFKRFVTTFPKGKLIHIYRNPYDAIASMMSRGFSCYYACSIYLLNTSFALSNKNHTNYFDLSYESLVTNNEQIKSLCKFLNVDFEDQMMQPHKHQFQDEPMNIGNWQYKENEMIGTRSVGRHKKLSLEQRSLIFSFCSSLQIKSKFATSHKLDFVSIKSICTHLGYKFQEGGSIDNLSLIKTQRREDLLFRTRKNAYYNLFNYPLELKKQ